MRGDRPSGNYVGKAIAEPARVGHILHGGGAIGKSRHAAPDLVAKVVSRSVSLRKSSGTPMNKWSSELVHRRRQKIHHGPNASLARSDVPLNRVFASLH
jgi:hypothetical protein